MIPQDISSQKKINDCVRQNISKEVKIKLDARRLTEVASHWQVV